MINYFNLQQLNKTSLQRENLMKEEHKKNKRKVQN